jgi:hypothetical protein
VVTLSGSVTDAAARTIAQSVPGVNVASDEIAHPYRRTPTITAPTTP